MKSHIKKGYKKKNERMLENYRIRFSKFVHMMMMWRHYILSYYKIREEKYYEAMYGKTRKKKQAKVDSHSSGPKTFDLWETLQFTEEFSPTKVKEESSAIPQDDDFGTINIAFFTEELYYYLMEVMHATAAMAYT